MHVDLRSLYECQLPWPSRTDRYKRTKSIETRKNESGGRICFSFPCHQGFPRKRVSIEAFCADCLHCLHLSAILIFLISFSFFYFTLQHHFKNSFQETSRQSLKLELYLSRREEVAQARLTSRDYCASSRQQGQQGKTSFKDDGKLKFTFASSKPPACSGWFSQ